MRLGRFDLPIFNAKIKIRNIMDNIAIQVGESDRRVE